MNENSKIIPLPKEDITCGMCGASDVKTRHVEDSFEFGRGNSTVFLSAIIPVHSCAECSFEFTDSKADDLCHEAVCRHLGLLTPAEIRKVRRDMSQAEFADQTGIGEASLGRWERGHLIQNVAMDNFLHLLRLPGNLEALRKRKRHSASSHTGSEHNFQCIDITELLTGQQVKFAF